MTTDNSPLLTVVICTWNRAALLRRALESHAAAQTPAGLTWELVVVDNSSTDDTPQVVEEFATRLPVRRILQPMLGLSFARNAGVQAARGTYVLWTDDDVLVTSTWLTAYADAIARWPDAAVFGGPIVPHFDDNPPEWLIQALPVVANAFALLELGNEPLPLANHIVPFGANYAIRTLEQRRHLYAPTLGRYGDNLSGGEETTVVRAILKEGGTGWYVPSTTVEHLIPQARQSVQYLRRYYSENTTANWHTDEPGIPMLFGRPRWLWRTTVEQEVLYRLTRLFAHPRRWALHLRQASDGWGALRASPRP